METPAPRRNGLAVILVVVLGLVGCDSVYTIHSIAAPGNEPSTVPDVSGLWAPHEIDSTSMVLRIAAQDYDTGQCRNADMRLLGAMNVDEETFGDQICFVPIAGHLVAQVRTAGEVQFYRQYLFRFDQQSMSFCDVVWADLLEWSEEHPQAAAGLGLEFVRRGWEDGTQLFVTSSSDALRTYLRARLPKLARACDEDHDEGPRWSTYTRMTPPRQPNVEGAVEELPSPPR